MKHKPIVIPEQISTDRPTRRMLGQWKKLHADFRHASKRVWYGSRNAATIEKARRRKRWIYLARILEIESYLLARCAKLTKHPDLWTRPTLPKTKSAEQVKRMPSTTNVSRRLRLITMYYESRRRCRALKGSNAEIRRKAMRADQQQLIIQIRALERDWMCAMFTSTHPEESPPAPLKLSAVDLRPRKVKRAIKTLQEEVA